MNCKTNQKANLTKIKESSTNLIPFEEIILIDELKPTPIKDFLKLKENAYVTVSGSLIKNWITKRSNYTAIVLANKKAECIVLFQKNHKPKIKLTELEKGSTYLVQGIKRGKEFIMGDMLILMKAKKGN